MGGKRGRLIPQADRNLAIELIDEACMNGARKHKACEILYISLRTYERWRLNEGTKDKRYLATRIPGNKLTSKERQRVIEVSNSAEYRDLSPWQIVPRLADKGEYIASESTFYRILKSEKLLSHRSASRPYKHKKPKELVATGPNQVWSWDITYLPTQIKGMHYYLYMIMDVFSRKIVGWIVHEEESADHAAALATQVCLDEGIEPEQVVLHSDNGSPMKGATMVATLQKLGVMPSFSRPSISNDNPYSESLFRTMKYHPTYPVEDKFASRLSATGWSEGFVTWYNTVHLHSSIRFVSPSQRHAGEDIKILEGRDWVYKQAKSNNPIRWSKNTRNWSYISRVVLNPGKGIKRHCS